MKKLMVMALCACMGMAAFAAGESYYAYKDESYHVYKFQFNAKTTDAKGIASQGCCGTEDEYCYREKKAVTIQGILAGCGCQAIEANGVCKNAVLYMWDATHKIAITNVEAATLPWTVQRIGKKATVIEHFGSLKASYGPEDMYGFEITLAGFGTYKDNKNDSNLSYVSGINGNFAGVATAPYYLKLGKCTACSTEPNEVYQTTAFAVCENCSEGLSESIEAATTPFFGAYKFAYDASKSKACSKNGLSKKNLGLPSYVELTDIAATNIEL